GAAPAASAGAPPEEPAPAGEPAEEPAEDEQPEAEEPAEAVQILSQFAAPVGQDYVARANLVNASSADVEVEVTIRFRGKNGEVFGEVRAEGPAKLRPGKRTSYKATLEGGAGLVETFE